MVRQTFLYRSSIATVASGLLSMGSPFVATGAETIVRVGGIPVDTDANIFYGLDNGFFKDAGLDVQYTPLNNGAATVAAIVGGSLDVGIANVATLAAARARGVNARFIAPAAVSTPTQQTDLLMVAISSPITKAADLNGKTIATTALKSLQQVTGSAWVDKNGGDSKTVKWVEIPFPQMAGALDAQRVDAAMISEPFVTLSRKTSRSLASTLQSIGPRYLLLGWCAADDWLVANPETARKFALSMRQASQWANDHPAESGVILAKYTKLDYSLVKTMARTNYGLELTAEMIAIPMDASVKYGAISKSVPVNDLIWRAPQ
jgi:NitT/TauT family transport system substrate-binding protein